MSMMSFQPILIHKYKDQPLQSEPKAIPLEKMNASPEESGQDPETPKFPPPNHEMAERINGTEYDTSDGFHGGGCLRIILNDRDNAPDSFL